MDQSPFPKSDPSILLLNEIDILQAQLRLMELYLKQAQATALNDAALLHQQHRAELARLHDDLAEKQQITRQHAELANQQRELAARLEALENQLAQRQHVLDERTQQLDLARAEIARLGAAISQQKLANQRAETDAVQGAAERQRLQTELTALQRLIEQERVDSQHRQLGAQQVERELRANVSELQAQLNDSQSGVREATDELERARAEIAAFGDRFEELQASRQQAAADAAAELARSRAGFEDEIRHLQNALAASDQSEQERAAALAELENSLNGEIVALRQELEQKQQWIEQRDGEWRRAAEETGSLRRQIGAFEVEREQALAEKARFELTRQTLDTEIAELHDAIARKERELTQRFESVSAVELALQMKIQALRQELARGENELAERDRQIGEIRADAELALQQAVKEARQQLENQLNELHVALGEKEAALEQVEAGGRDMSDRLRGEVAHLRSQVDRERSEAAQVCNQLEAAHNEIAALRERHAALEQARQEFEQNWQRAGFIQSELQARLKTKTDELAQALTELAELRQQGGDNVNELQLELAHKQLLADSRTSEIDDLKAKLSELGTQLAEAQGWRQQADRRRHAHDEEIAALQEKHQSRVRTLENDLETVRRQADDTSIENRQAAQRTGQLETELHQSSENLASTRAEAAALRAQVDELTGAQASSQAQVRANEQERDLLGTELAALREQLQQSHWALAQQQAGAEAVAAAQRDELLRLESKLSEQQSGTMQRDSELEKANAQARALKRRIEELEIELRHAEITALSRADQMRQENSARMDALEAALKQKSAELEERDAAQTGLDQPLRREIDRLERDIAERDHTLQTRGDELARSKSQLERLQARFHELESVAAQAKTESVGDIESLRADFHARLARLQTELNQKDTALAQQQASLTGVEQHYQQELVALRRQLNELASVQQQTASAPAIGAVPLERLVPLESGPDAAATTLAQQADPLPAHRWRSRFVAKRRWKI
jgi:chromosome segregation ATPase